MTVKVSLPADASAAPALRLGGADSDLCFAAFGPVLGALPKEMLDRVIPATRAVMLRQVSRGVREALATVRPVAMVRAMKLHRETAFLAGRLEGLLSWCRITALHLRGVFLRPTHVDGLVGVLKQCKALAHLDLKKNLSSNRIGDEGTGKLAGVLAECGSLTHLIFGSNRIGADGAGRLADALRKCKALAHLNLVGNDLGGEGAGRLVGVLGGCGPLTHLILGSNRIGSEGAVRLAGVLGECKSLAHLDLSYNLIGDEGVGRLAGVLGQKLRSLVRLDLSYNHLGDYGKGLFRAVDRDVQKLLYEEQDTKDDEQYDEDEEEESEEESEE